MGNIIETEPPPPMSHVRQVYGYGYIAVVLKCPNKVRIINETEQIKSALYQIIR